MVIYTVAGILKGLRQYTVKYCLPAGGEFIILETGGVWLGLDIYICQYPGHLWKCPCQCEH